MQGYIAFFTLKSGIFLTLDTASLLSLLYNRMIHAVMTGLRFMDGLPFLPGSAVLPYVIYSI